MSRRRRLARTAAYVLFICVVAELAVRGYWALIGGSFLDAPNRMHYLWYPELEGVESSRDDGVLDVALLGNSTLDALAGVIGDELGRAVDRPVRIHNFSKDGHTSLDSRSKYLHLAGRRFDLVIFHHAINEARANNCPPEMFREDYTHYAWYRPILLYDADPHRVLALPITLRYVWAKLAPQLGLVEVVPKHRPREEWLQYGADVKTAAAMRRNVEWIAATAASRGDPLVLLTFATCVPEGYSDERFLAGELGFAEGGLPTGLWGRPQDVVAAIAIHNDVVRGVGRRMGVPVVEMVDAVPKEMRLWRDICHFSDEGSRLWAAALVAALMKRELLAERPASRHPVERQTSDVER